MEAITTAFDHLWTRRELLESGVDVTRIGKQLSEGRLIRIRRGVYADRDWLLGLRYERRLAAQAVAYHKASHRRPVFVRQCAAIFHGLAVGKVPQRLQIAGIGRSGAVAGKVHSYAIPNNALDAVVEVEGLLVTSLLDTLVDCVMSLPVSESLIMTESALNREARHYRYRVNPTPLAKDLGEKLATIPCKSSARVRLAIDSMSIFSESAGETLTLQLLRRSGLSLPIQQFRIGTDRVDFAWVKEKVVLEFDGMIKYSETGTARDVFLGEKEREARLTAAGWRVIRTTWEEVTKNPQRLIDRLRRAGVRGA